VKQRIESYGIPTSDVATENGSDAFLYVRDPAGNLFVLYCEQGFGGSARRTTATGGDYEIDVSALVYDDWNDPGA
jgi:hypothetical protein